MDLIFSPRAKNVYPVGYVRLNSWLTEISGLSSMKFSLILRKLFIPDEHLGLALPRI